MLFSIGYETLTPARLVEVAILLNVTVVDCRSHLGRTKAGFGRASLIERLGDRYDYQGSVLGGRGEGVQESGLQWLRAEHARGQRLMLMCQESAPGDCHRHRSIAVPLLASKIDVLHVFHDIETGVDQVFHASALERAILEGDDGEYDFITLTEYCRLNNRYAR